MRIILLASILMISAASAASASDWEKFYHPLPRSTVPLDPTLAAAQVGSTGPDGKADLDRMWEQGYELIGYTTFNSPRSNTNDALKLAAKLKADYVLLNTSLASSKTINMPITVPNTTTSTTNGSVNVSGNYGVNATGNYSGTTTSYGSSTNYIPITVNRYEKLALFFVRLKRSGTGIHARDLNPQERQMLGTNRGLVVDSIRTGSPAYISDILPGDIILSIDGIPADWEAATAWRKRLLETKLQNSRLVVWRRGERKEVVFKMLDDWRGA